MLANSIRLSLDSRHLCVCAAPALVPQLQTIHCVHLAQQSINGRQVGMFRKTVQSINCICLLATDAITVIATIRHNFSVRAKSRAAMRPVRLVPSSLRPRPLVILPSSRTNGPICLNLVDLIIRCSPSLLSSPSFLFPH